MTRTLFLLTTIAAGVGILFGSLQDGAGNENKPSSLEFPEDSASSNGFAVLELFTSEGCSSCPSAERLLNAIGAEAERKGTAVYPLAFHVDYWNSLGWKDRFSDPEFSMRQRRYRDVMKLRHVYTPQMIVNGTSELVGSDRNAALSAIGSALAGSATIHVKILSVEQSESGDDLTVACDVEGVAGDAVLNLALVETGLRTDVRHGENAGKTLVHDNVVRSFLSTPLSGKTTGRLAMPEEVDLSRSDVIAYVQDTSTMAILAAARSSVHVD